MIGLTKMNKEEILLGLDKMIPNPRCELNYNKDYELLIATVLSAQSTDKRVNIVTKELFKKYDIFSLKDAEVNNIKSIIKTVGSYHKKAIYLKEIATSLVNNYNGKVPNNRDYLESLKGVGRKTTNVVLANLYNEPTFAVDTHMIRVSRILGISNESDNVLSIEKKLMKYFKDDDWNKINDQMILFGRYICTAKNSKCEMCYFKNKCKKMENKNGSQNRKVK